MAARRLFPTTFLLLLVAFPAFASAACLSQGCTPIAVLLAQLPPAKRKLLDDTLKRAEKENSKLREQKLKHEAELDKLLAAPDFDKRSFLDNSAKLGTLRAKMSANLDDAIAGVAAQFSLQERGVLLKMRQLWHTHGYHEEWSRDDEEDNHQPAPE